MHQTFYIDIDEEITSIVEKLRKTEVSEVVIVVPKRALLIQSIVNLKLLRKVADDLGLKLSIVTQDKLGKMLVKKAGISLQQKLEDNLEELEVANNGQEVSRREFKKEVDATELEDTGFRSKRDLDKIGSADYFSSANEEGVFPDRERDWKELEDLRDEKVPLMNNLIGNRKVTVTQKTDFDSENISQKRTPSTMDVSGPARNATHSVAGGPAQGIAGGLTRQAAAKNETLRSGNDSAFGVPVRRINSEAVTDFPEIPYSKTRPNYLESDQSESGVAKKEAPRDQQLENFFYANNYSDKNRQDYSGKKKELAQNSSSGFLRVTAIVGAVGLVCGLAYLAYLYLPKATVTVFAKKEVKSSDIEITGNVNHENIDYDRSVIPAKVMEFDEEVAKTFNATGTGNVSNQKARGKITIYNEFSSAPQPLVATTRFLSDDQKIFRLVQGVTIPGTTKVGNEIKPGVIEADVIADEAGDSFNIGATNFTIPGFKSSGNDKYAKIYAKSGSSMSGGGSGNDTIKIVSSKDISDAKDKISLEINNAIKDKVKGGASGMVILDDAIAIDEPVYRVSNSEGETADTFEIKVQAHARALVFSQSDAKKIANSIISKSGNGKINIDSGSVILDYGKVNANFKLGTIDIKMHAANVMQPNVDLESLKKGILGKNNDELADYLKTYPSIEKAEVEYFPQLFISKIPTNEKRVEVILNATTP